MANIISKLLLVASLVLLTTSGAFAASQSQDAHPVTDAHLEGEIEEAFGVEAAHPVHAEHGGEENSSGGLPQLDPTWYASQIFWLVLTFASLYLIFSRKILPELSSTIEDRRQRIDGDLEQAETLRDEAEKVHLAYETILEEARNKSSDVFLKTEQKMKDQTSAKLDAFRETSLTETQKAEANVAKTKKAAMKDMDLIAAEIAAQAAEKIIGIKADIRQVKTVIDSINKKAA